MTTIYSLYSLFQPAGRYTSQHTWAILLEAHTQATSRLFHFLTQYSSRRAMLGRRAQSLRTCALGLTRHSSTHADRVANLFAWVT